MAKENKQLIKTWEDRYQDYLNIGLNIHNWGTLNGIANSTFSYWVIKFKNIQVEKTTTDKNPNTKDISIQNTIHHWIKVANSSVGIAGIVQGSFGQDPFNGELFVFINKSKNAVKVLQWDIDGFVLYHKRRERGKFFWPFLKDEESTIEISSNDLEGLLAGLVMEKFIPRKNYTMM